MTTIVGQKKPPLYSGLLIDTSQQKYPANVEVLVCCVRYRRDVVRDCGFLSHTRHANERELLCNILYTYTCAHSATCGTHLPVCRGRTRRAHLWARTDAQCDGVCGLRERVCVCELGQIPHGACVCECVWECVSGDKRSECKNAAISRSLG